MELLESGHSMNAGWLPRWSIGGEKGGGGDKFRVIAGLSIIMRVYEALQDFLLSSDLSGKVSLSKGPGLKGLLFPAQTQFLFQS